MNSEKEKALREAGYRPSAYDSGKWINGSNSVKEHEGGSTTFDTSRHNTYGVGMSDREFAERLKK